MFQFNISKEIFILHSKLISRYFFTLHALMCGYIMQAEEKQTSINNMDKNTFTRFVKFIYKNDYNVAEALIIFNNLNTKRRRSESPSPKSLKVDAVDPPYLNDILTSNPPPQTK